MKITADTNILVRAITEDDPKQAKIAQRVLNEATLVAIPLTSFAEFCWVVERVYKFGKADIARAIRTWIAADNVVVDRPAIEAGLTMLDAGGDFADAVIAHSGKWLGAETFVSFDKTAVRLLSAQGVAAKIPK